jgi:hypothetical protein
VVYKDTALTGCNRVVDDVSRGAGRDVLTRDLTTAIRQIGDAATDSRGAAATRSLRAVRLACGRCWPTSGRVAPYRVTCC